MPGAASGGARAAKRWAADRLGSRHEEGAMPLIARNGDVVAAYQHGEKLFMT